jgi:hypothetical protein
MNLNIWHALKGQSDSEDMRGSHPMMTVPVDKIDDHKSENMHDDGWRWVGGMM